jgi:hypothetical protein
VQQALAHPGGKVLRVSAERMMSHMSSDSLTQVAHVSRQGMRQP